MSARDSGTDQESAPVFTFFGAYPQKSMFSVEPVSFARVHLEHLDSIRLKSAGSHPRGESAQPWPRLPEVPPRRRACQSAP